MYLAAPCSLKPIAWYATKTTIAHAAVVALLLASGHADPIAIVGGLSVIPVTVIAEGLRTVREDA